MIWFKLLQQEKLISSAAPQVQAADVLVVVETFIMLQ